MLHTSHRWQVYSAHTPNAHAYTKSALYRWLPPQIRTAPEHVCLHIVYAMPTVIACLMHTPVYNYMSIPRRCDPIHTPCRTLWANGDRVPMDGTVTPFAPSTQILPAQPYGHCIHYYLCTWMELLAYSQPCHTSCTRA